jgi:FlaG/FlaF family flagellin (archaellin)
MTTVLSPAVDSSWNAVRLLVVALVIVAAASLAFVAGRVTHSSHTNTVTRVVPASAPDLCRGAHRGAC